MSDLKTQIESIIQGEIDASGVAREHPREFSILEYDRFCRPIGLWHYKILSLADKELTAKHYSFEVDNPNISRKC